MPMLVGAARGWNPSRGSGQMELFTASGPQFSCTPPTHGSIRGELMTLAPVPWLWIFYFPRQVGIFAFTARVVLWGRELRRALSLVSLLSPSLQSCAHPVPRVLSTGPSRMDRGAPDFRCTRFQMWLQKSLAPGVHFVWLAPLIQLLGMQNLTLGSISGPVHFPHSVVFASLEKKKSR